MEASMPSCFISGSRSIQPPLEQYAPTFDDVKEETASGPSPLRSAAVILSSSMPPTRSMVTSGWAASYSPTTFLKTSSSRSDQPTQREIFCAGPVAAAVAPAAVPAAAVLVALESPPPPQAATTSASPHVTSVAVRARLIRPLLHPLSSRLVNDSNEMQTLLSAFTGS